MNLLWIIVIFLAILLIGPYHERKRWNEGKCRKHGNIWKYFDTDSQGGRGYNCDMPRAHTTDRHGRQTALECTTWISYGSVDR